MPTPNIHKNYIDLSGTSVKSENDKIVRGSDAIDQIWIVTPFDTSMVIDIAFELANGKRSTYIPLINLGETEEVTYDDNGTTITETWNVFRQNIPSTILSTIALIKNATRNNRALYSVRVRETNPDFLGEYDTLALLGADVSITPTALDFATVLDENTTYEYDGTDWVDLGYVKGIYETTQTISTKELTISPSVISSTAVNYTQDDFIKQWISALSDDVTYLLGEFYPRSEIEAELYALDGSRALLGNMNVNGNDLENVRYIYLDANRRFAYNTVADTISIQYLDNSVPQNVLRSLEIGQENEIHARNATSLNPLPNGKPVYINDTTGQRPTIEVIDITNDVHAQRTIGLVTENDGILRNALGKVTTFGLVREVSTLGFPDNSTLWVGTDGNLTITKPVAPNNAIKVGLVINGQSATQGLIFVCVERIPKLTELSDVTFTHANGDILISDGTKFGGLNLNTYLDGKFAGVFKGISLNPTTYVMTFTLWDNSTVSIDLPLEQIIVSGEYDEVNRDLILTLDNGSTIVIPIDDIFVGLATQTWVNTQLTNFYTKTESDNRYVRLTLPYDEITEAVMNGSEQFYAKDSSGNFVRITSKSIKDYVFIGSNIFNSTVDYSSDGLGAYETATTKVLQPSNPANSDLLLNLVTLAGERKLTIEVPSTLLDVTQPLRVTMDNGSTYYNVKLNDVNVLGNAVLGKILELHYDGTNIKLYDVGIVSTVAPYIGNTNHFDTPKNGIDLAIGKKSVTVPEVVKGLTYEQLFSNGQFDSNVTGWVNGSGTVVSESGTAKTTRNNTINSGYFQYNTNLGLKLGQKIFISFDIKKQHSYNATAKVLYFVGATPHVTTLSPVLQTSTRQYCLLTLVGDTERIQIFVDLDTPLGVAEDLIYYYDNAYAIKVPPILSTYTASQLSRIFPQYISQGLHTLGESGEITFTSVGDNLFDKSNLVSNKAINFDTGVVTNNPANDVSNYITVKPNTTYNRSGIATMGYYDIDKNFISSTFSSNFTTPNNCYYLNITIDKTSEDYETYMINKGTTALPYSAYETDTSTLYTPNGLNSVESIYDDELVKRVGIETAVAVSAVVNNTLITTMSISYGFIAVDETNGEVQYGAYGDTLTLTNTATVYYVLAEPTYRTLDIDGQLTITPKGLFTMQDSNGVANEVDLEVAQDSQAQPNSNVKELIRQSKELEELKDELHIAEMDDLRFPVTQTRIGANAKPDFDETNVALLFPANNEAEIVYIVAQFPHSREPDSAVMPHVHIRQEATGQPVFEMQYKWYNIGEQVPATWETFVMNTNVNTWTTGTLATFVGGGSIDGTNKGVSSIMLIKLYRQTGDGVVGDVKVDEFDIHYYKSRFGKNVI